MYNKSPIYIKQEINPLNFFQNELPNAVLKNQGWNNGGLCPFHADTKPGSFHVNSETGSFNCFSCGTKGGDVIAFTMVLYDLNFPEALVKLAEDWGL
ncbi:MAG: CHC2 zinc finger domain-containing protein [Methylobacter sp.]